MLHIFSKRKQIRREKFPQIKIDIDTLGKITLNLTFLLSKLILSQINYSSRIFSMLSPNIFTILSVSYCTCPLSTGLSTRVILSLLIEKSIFYVFGFFLSNLTESQGKIQGKDSASIVTSFCLRFHCYSATDNTNSNFIV